MARITLPGFSRGIYAVGPLIFEDGVCEVEGDLPLVVERLAYALGASIDGADAPTTDPGLQPQEPPVDETPTPADLWGIGDRLDGDAAQPAEAAPEIDYLAPTGGVTSDQVDSTTTGPTVDYSAPTSNAPAPGSDAAPSEPQPTNPDGTPIPAPVDQPVDVTDPSVPPADDSTSGKHAADEPVDAEPAADPTPVPAQSAPDEDVAAAAATDTTVVASSTDGTETVDAPAQGN